MKLDFFKLSPDERRLYIEQAAIQKNASPVIMEKDFWVCWFLNILFKSEFAESPVFKGGTSLSKVYGAINRFFEDIDLFLSPTFLKLPEPEILSRAQGAKMTREQTKSSLTEMFRKENGCDLTLKRKSIWATSKSKPNQSPTSQKYNPQT